MAASHGIEACRPEGPGHALGRGAVAAERGDDERAVARRVARVLGETGVGVEQGAELVEAPVAGRVEERGRAPVRM
jgi:hypothetical protein